MPALALLAGGIVALPLASLAGPPYVTDDPEPTDPGHWEDYAFVTGTANAGQSQGQTGIELNYGAAKDVQVTAWIPEDFLQQRDSYRFGPGDLELSAKYRFLHQSDDSLIPDVAFFPQANLPTQSRAFGSGRVSWFLPFWAEKDLGPWSTFGGGGYEINPGAGNHNFWLFGWALTRAITDRLTVGGEIYHQTATADGDRDLTALAFGMSYQLSEHFHVLASGGPGIQNASETTQSAFFTALELTY